MPYARIGRKNDPRFMKPVMIPMTQGIKHTSKKQLSVNNERRPRRYIILSLSPPLPNHVLSIFLLTMNYDFICATLLLLLPRERHLTDANLYPSYNPSVTAQIHDVTPHFSLQVSLLV